MFQWVWAFEHPECSGENLCPAVKWGLYLQTRLCVVKRVDFTDPKNGMHVTIGTSAVAASTAACHDAKCTNTNADTATAASKPYAYAATGLLHGPDATAYAASGTCSCACTYSYRTESPAHAGARSFLQSPGQCPDYMPFDCTHASCDIVGSLYARCS
jgi:hypothetical protein